MSHKSLRFYLPVYIMPMIELTEAELKLIVEYLSNQPWKDVNHLIVLLNQKWEMAAKQNEKRS